MEATYTAAGRWGTYQPTEREVDLAPLLATPPISDPTPGCGAAGHEGRSAPRSGAKAGYPGGIR